MELQMGTLVKVIILLVSFAFIYGVYVAFVNTATAETVKAACQASIAKSEAFSSTGQFNPVDIQCPRRIIQIQAEETRILNTNLFEKVSKSSEYSYRHKTAEGAGSKTISRPSDVAEAVAYEMGECWDTFERGTIDPLKDATWAFFPEQTCMICAEFHTTEQNITITNFTDILQATPHHYLDEAGRRATTYDDFLYGLASQANPHICRSENYMPDQRELSITPDQPLAVVYYKHGAARANLGESCQAVEILPVVDIAERCFVVI